MAHRERRGRPGRPAEGRSRAAGALWSFAARRRAVLHARLLPAHRLYEPRRGCAAGPGQWLADRQPWVVRAAAGARPHRRSPDAARRWRLGHGHLRPEDAGPRAAEAQLMRRLDTPVSIVRSTLFWAVW